ncbi:hypothetical protein GTY23_05435 [Streptomyces sp. SID5998]|nr:hypothetical protein [Streptomyces sp. SID5998]
MGTTWPSLDAPSLGSGAAVANGGTASCSRRRPRARRGVLVLGLTSIHEAMADMADGHVDHDELVAGVFTEVKVPGKNGGTGEH